MLRREIRRITRDEAEGIAISALGYMAGEPERLDRFLALTGLGVGNLRAAAAEPGFLGQVLAHVASDEALLLAFATETAMDPALIAAALAKLDGPPAGF